MVRKNWSWITVAGCGSHYFRSARFGSFWVAANFSTAERFKYVFHSYENSYHGAYRKRKYLISNSNWVSNSKSNLLLYDVELVRRKKNFYKNFRVSNSTCDVILCNSVSWLDFVTGEFWTSFKEITPNKLQPYLIHKFAWRLLH